MLVRPMRAGDLEAAERVTADAFFDLDRRTRPTDWPAAERRTSEGSARWIQRMRHLLDHDPRGCWVLEYDGLVGVAGSLRREGLWGLSTYAVHPRAQGTGAGKALLEAALSYSQGCLRGMICSSHDSRAARRYRQAGFALHPTMLMWGRVDRSVLPVVDRVRDGSAADIDLCNSVDRQTRGAGHGVDHEVMAAEMHLVVVDHPTGSGYCYIAADGAPYLLAATNRRTATRLLWESLAAAGAGPITFSYVTAAQEWAVDVALAAGLQVHNRGYVALRTMKPPMPYIPSRHLL